MRFLSIRPDPERAGCSSAKKAYPSEEDALGAAEHSERTRGVRLGVYHCVECLAWHLTSRT